MFNFDPVKLTISGQGGSISIRPDDDLAVKLLMLIEGECSLAGPLKTAKKYHYSKQRYFQLRDDFKEGGALALKSKKTGPKTKYRQSEEIIRQVIRYRYLNRKASVNVTTQKLKQSGFGISQKTVQRIIERYGLQKKTLFDETRRKF
jgi:hypothetical protein